MCLNEKKILQNKFLSNLHVTIVSTLRQLFLLGSDGNALTVFISSLQRERILNIERICNLLRRVSNSCLSPAGGGWLKQRGFTQLWPFVFFIVRTVTHTDSHVAHPYNTPLPLHRPTAMENTDTVQVLGAFSFFFFFFTFQGFQKKNSVSLKAHMLWRPF